MWTGRGGPETKKKIIETTPQEIVIRNNIVIVDSREKFGQKKDRDIKIHKRFNLLLSTNRSFIQSISFL